MLVGFCVSLGAAFVALVATLALERFRRPDLVIEPSSTSTRSYPELASLGRCRFLHVAVRNLRMPWFLRWAWDRQAADRCRAEICFYDSDVKPVGDGAMPGKWVAGGEPVAVFPDPHSPGKVARIFDSSRGSQHIDIPSNHGESLDVANRFESSDDCWGWTNESYPYGWKHPRWHFQLGHYYVFVSVVCGERVATNWFELNNRTGFDEFCLRSVDKKTKKRLEEGKRMADEERVGTVSAVRQDVPPHDTKAYSDIFWANLYGTTTGFGRQETTLIWSRYAGFVVANGIIVNVLAQKSSGLPWWALLSLGVIGSGLVAVWHILNFSGWYNQNVWYWMAARIKFTGVECRLPTDWWSGDVPPKPTGFIYHSAQVVPVLFFVIYGAATGFALHRLHSPIWLAVLAGLVSVGVWWGLSALLEWAEYRRRAKDIRTVC